MRTSPTELYIFEKTKDTLMEIQAELKQIRHLLTDIKDGQ